MSCPYERITIMPSLDVYRVLSASALVYTGPGWLAGLVCSCKEPNAHAILTLYDNTAGSGTKTFEAEIDGSNQPFVLFFQDRYAPRFTTGCYASLAAGLVVNIWIAAR